MFSPLQISQAANAPLGNCEREWPRLVEALGAYHMDDRPVLIAAAATVSAETGSFAPIPEYGTGEEYEGRADLGNVQPGDGPRYKGRGLIQLTGRANYRSYGQQLGVDLEGSPDLALDPTVSARVFALYFRTTNCDGLARGGDWYGVRRAVNGGLNGIVAFMAVVNALSAMPDSAPVPSVTTVGAEHGTILRTQPVSDAPHAKGVAHPDGLLPFGQVVTFCPDPAPGPHHGQTTTPHFAHVRVGAGPMHGWLLRGDLSTRA